MEMNNQNQNQHTQTPDPEQTETNTPEQILAEMKENMVPKEEAVKWQQKYNELFRNVANGTFTNEDKSLSEEDKRKALEENVKEMTGEASVKPLDFFQNLVDFVVGCLFPLQFQRERDICPYVEVFEDIVLLKNKAEIGVAVTVEITRRKIV